MKKRVLLAEDDKFFRFAVKKMIDWEKYGFQIVGEAVHGAAALEFLKENTVDVVVTDMSMPVMNGIELTRALKEQYPEIMIIALSAYDDFEFVKESLILGAQDYILKQDIDKEDVGAVIWKAWEKHRKELSGSEKIKNGVRKLLEGSGETKYAEEFLELCLENQWGYYLCRIENLEQNWKSSNCLKEIWLEDSVFELHDNKEHIILWPVLKEHSIKNQMNDRDSHLRVLEEMLSEEIYAAGCSNPAESVQKFYQVGQEAKMAAEVSLFSKRKKICIWEYVRGEYRNREKDFAADKNGYGDIVQLEQAEAVLMELTEEMYRKMPLETDIQTNYLELMTAIGRNLNFELGNEEFALLKNRLEFNRNLNVKHEICRKYLQEIFAWGEQKNVHPSVRVGIQFMKQNYKDNLSLTDIAEYAGLNESYFSGIFKKDTGKSITEYLNEIRVEKAKELIETTNYKNYEIGEQVGIYNSSYFSTVFKRLTGMTIQEYRKRCGK